MKKRIRLTEGQLYRLIEQSLNELSSQTYMNAANKRHQNAMDYLRFSSDATGAEKRRLEKWENQSYGTPLQAGKNRYYTSYGPMGANSEENMRSANALRQHAREQYKQENQTDKVPDSMYQWESIAHNITEGVIRKIYEWSRERQYSNFEKFDSFTDAAKAYNPMLITLMIENYCPSYDILDTLKRKLVSKYNLREKYDDGFKDPQKKFNIRSSLEKFAEMIGADGDMKIIETFDEYLKDKYPSKTARKKFINEIIENCLFAQGRISYY